MRLTPSMLTRNRSTKTFHTKYLYDFNNPHNNLLLTFLELKYLNSCLKSKDRKNKLEPYCRIECYINVENRILTFNNIHSMTYMVYTYVRLL